MAEKTLECCISQLGEVQGTKQFNIILKARETRQLLKTSGKSVAQSLMLLTDDEKEQSVIDGDAVKCKECGYIGSRLQHTHFKYKCSGRFTNGKDYKIFYPGELVVAPNLAKSTGGTLVNYIKKYGEVEGQRRWDEYKNKQADSNSFEYKQEKHGWSHEQYDEYNASRASTLENFIIRHGIKEGTRLREEYIERQRYTTSLEYFIDEYGEIEGQAKYDNFDSNRAIVNASRISCPEQEMYNILITHIPHLSQQIFVTGNTRKRIFDMGTLEDKKLIEFNGTFWHMDPRKYDANIINNVNKMTAHQVWERDARKLKDAESAGYKVLVIWEDEWKVTKQVETIAKILEWWNND